jgi:hypothetical protein
MCNVVEKQFGVFQQSSLAEPIAKQGSQEPIKCIKSRFALCIYLYSPA